MDDALSKALKLKQQLQDELVKVEQFIALHKDIFGEGFGQRELPLDTPKAPNESHQVNSAPLLKAPRKKKPKRLKTDRLVRVAERILREVGRPLTRGEMVKELEKRGVRLKSSDNPRYVGTIMWRNREKFVNAGDGYWLRGETYTVKDPHTGELYEATIEDAA